MPHTFSTMAPDPPVNEAAETTTHPDNEAPAPPAAETQAAASADGTTEPDSDAPAPPPDRHDDSGAEAEVDMDAPSPPAEEELVEAAIEGTDGSPLPPGYEDAAITTESGDMPPLPPD